MKRQRDERDLSLRLEADGIHNDATSEPALALAAAGAGLGCTPFEMERIVACVNACRGIRTEHLGIVSALDEADRSLMAHRVDPGFDAQARWLNRDLAEDLLLRRYERTGKAAQKPTIEQKIDLILAAIERGSS